MIGQVRIGQLSIVLSYSVFYNNKKKCFLALFRAINDVNDFDKNLSEHKTNACIQMYACIFVYARKQR